MLTEQVLGVFAVWVAWTLANYVITAPSWTWYIGAVVGGVIWEVVIHRSTWYLGVGVGGAAVVLMIITDLLLVVTDNAKVAVLRNRRT